MAVGHEYYRNIIKYQYILKVLKPLIANGAPLLRYNFGLTDESAEDPITRAPPRHDQTLKYTPD